MCSGITTLPTKKDTHNKQKQNIMKKTFICTVCGYMYEGTEAPAECPICHSKTEKFKAFDANAVLRFSSVFVPLIALASNALNFSVLE